MQQFALKRAFLHLNLLLGVDVARPLRLLLPDSHTARTWPADSGCPVEAAARGGPIASLLLLEALHHCLLLVLEVLLIQVHDVAQRHRRRGTSLQ